MVIPEASACIALISTTKVVVEAQCVLLVSVSVLLVSVGKLIVFIFNF